VVSHASVNRRLREFVCVRLDHEQMQRLKHKLRVPTQGNQVLFTSRGEYVEDTDPRGKRYKIEELVPILDRVLAEHGFKLSGEAIIPGPMNEAASDLRLAWFFWNPEDYGLPRVFGAETVCRLDRKPLLVLDGPAPDWLDESTFLRRHVRQFVWTRGERFAEPRITIRQLEPERRELAQVALNDVTAETLSAALDKAWIQYMQARPLTARGYIDNEHGNWLKTVMERAHAEEVHARDAAHTGTLLPPGRENNR
jgi:hypothetical protein